MMPMTYDPTFAAAPAATQQPAVARWPVAIAMVIGMSLGAIVGLSLPAADPTTHLHSAVVTNVPTVATIGAAPTTIRPLAVRSVPSGPEVELVDRMPMADADDQFQPTMTRATMNLPWLAGVAALGAAAGVLLSKLTAPQKPPMALASVAGHRSMALNATAVEPPMPPMNCRYVDVNEPGYRVLGKTDIPLPISRSDLVNSVQGWAMNELREKLEENHEGFKLLVDFEADQITEAENYSLTLRFLAPTGEYIVIEYCLDNQEIEAQRTIEGFLVESGNEQPHFKDAQGNVDPRTIAMYGSETTQKGRQFIVRRKESVMADCLRPMVAESLSELGLALNRYYAFGTLFLEDTL